MISFEGAHFPKDIILYVVFFYVTEKNDWAIDTLYDYWVLGKNAEPLKPRWSIIRNVLNLNKREKDLQ